MASSSGVSGGTISRAVSFSGHDPRLTLPSAGNGVRISYPSDAGPRWADGQSVLCYIGSQAERTSFHLVTELRPWVWGQPWIHRIVSAATLPVELPAWVGMYVSYVGRGTIAEGPPRSRQTRTGRRVAR